MSFGFNAIAKPQQHVSATDDLKEGLCGIPNAMTYGLCTGTKDNLTPTHSLQQREAMHFQMKEQVDFLMARNSQGLHAPLRLMMERSAAKQVGHLPFLPSSNFMLDVLTHRDETIDFTDILNIPEFQEQVGQPHAVMEKKSGIL